MVYIIRIYHFAACGARATGISSSALPATESDRFFSLRNHPHPEVRVSLQHEFLNNDRNITSSFAQGNGPSFGFNVRHPARNTSITGVGVTVDFSDRWSGYVNYTGQLSSDQTSHTITAGMKMTW